MYHSCSRLPLDKFINVLVDGDLYELIISGIPPIADLAEAWANIFAEYVDLNGDPESSYLLQLQMQIALLQIQLSETESAFYFLTVMYREDLVQVIEDNGYSIAISDEMFISDIGAYMTAIEQASEQLAPDRLRFETLSKEYESYMVSKEGVVMDRQYFSKILRRLAKYCGVPVLRAKELTVEEYVLLFKDYVEYINAHNKQIEPEEA